MTEDPQKAELTKTLDEIKESVNETQAIIDTLREELDEQTKEVTKQLAEINAFMHNVLEPNQQKIWLEGIGVILRVLGEIKETTEINEDHDGAEEWTALDVIKTYFSYSARKY